MDSLLGPEMKSTGEVMGIAKAIWPSIRKSTVRSECEYQSSTTCFCSVRDADKSGVASIAKRLAALGFEVLATQGTAKVIESTGIPCRRVNKSYRRQTAYCGYDQE